MLFIFCSVTSYFLVHNLRVQQLFILDMFKLLIYYFEAPWSDSLIVFAHYSLFTWDMFIKQLRLRCTLDVYLFL